MIGPHTSSDLNPPSVNQDSFAGGMRDRDYPSLLDPNQYAYAKDIEARDSGLAKLRSGRTTKSTTIGSFPQGGVWYKDNSGNEYLVTVNTGKTYYWGGSGMGVTQIGTTVFSNTSTNVSFSILNGTLYIAPGTGDNNYSWTGSGSLTDEGNTNTDGPRGTLLCQQAGRLFSGGEAPARQDYICASDIFDGHTWSRSANNRRIPTDGSERISAIASYRKQEILVQTPFSTHSLDVSGTDVTAFVRNQLDAKIGNGAPRTLTVVSDDAFFMSPDKQIRTIKRTVQDLAFGVTNPITYFVPNLMSRINSTSMNLCAGIYFNNYYLLAVPLDSNTTNSGIIPFDMLHQFATPSGNAPICVGEWTNMAVNQFVVTYFSGIQKLHYIDANDGSIKQMFDGSTSDDVNTLTAQIDFRAFDYGAPAYLKTAHDGELQFVNSSGTATLSFKKDDNTWIPLGSKVIGETTANLPIDLPFNLPADSGINPWLFPMYRQGRSKYWQMRLNFTGSTMNLKQLCLRSWIENVLTR
jgi:hypothetical protein